MMSKRQLLTHNTYCELMTDKKPSRIYAIGSSQIETKKPVKGIKQADVSKAMLARQLMSLF